jgi:hypothetical protein
MLAPNHQFFLEGESIVNPQNNSNLTIHCLLSSSFFFNRPLRRFDASSFEIALDPFHYLGVLFRKVLIGSWDWGLDKKREDPSP